MAIVGAGISGLTCAEELHNLGHKVEIFEKSPRNFSSRPKQMEGSVYLLNNIPKLPPDRLMQKIILHSTNVTSVLNGKLGFFYEIGGSTGIDVRLRRRVEKVLQIHYSTKINSKSELEEFDIVVAADGYQSLLAKEAELITSKVPNQFGIGLGFTVNGDFDPNSIEIWLGNHFSSKGYTYLIPFSSHEASLVSASVVKKMNSSIYRGRLKELARIRNWHLREEWADLEFWYDFLAFGAEGFYVIGNAGSFIDTAFGFGLKWALESANLCCQAIHKNKDYNTLVQKELLSDLKSFEVMRRFFDVAKESDYDKFVKKFKNRFVRKFAESGGSMFKHKRLMSLIFPRA